MTTIIVFFSLSLFFSILITPFIRKLGNFIGALDYPDSRKAHNGVIPRCGGIVIYLSFFLPFISLFFYKNNLLNLLYWNIKVLGFLFCSSLIFLIGLWDDIKRLSASYKLIAQIIIAFIAWWSGFRIEKIVLPYFDIINLSFLGLPITIFWFLMFINAINLIDGLDGLATGISLFTTIVLAIISLMRNNYLEVLIFITFAGGLLGFLRYNFSPASIFLGDSGSYFIGFVLAALGLATSQKSSMTIAILIPIVALGLPMIDLILSGFRRFIFGSKILKPDNDHIHHKLIQLGYSTRKAVFILYGIAILFGSLSLLMVNQKDERIGFILVIISIISILLIRKLGYIEYFSKKRLINWFADISDETGIRRDRRCFLNQQVSISKSKNIYQFWGRLIQVGKTLNLDWISLQLNPEHFGNFDLPRFVWEDNKSQIRKFDISGVNNFIKIELSIANHKRHYGTICIIRTIDSYNEDRYLLRRIEHLHRNIIDTLDYLAKESFFNQEVLRDRRQKSLLIKNSIFDVLEHKEWVGIERRKFSRSENIISRNTI